MTAVITRRASASPAMEELAPFVPTQLNKATVKSLELKSVSQSYNNL
ncbi:MAG: hypothetical protein ACYC0C_15075 [Devosia sp.]